MGQVRMEGMRCAIFPMNPKCSPTKTHINGCPHPGPRHSPPCPSPPLPDKVLTGLQQ